MYLAIERHWLCSGDAKTFLFVGMCISTQCVLDVWDIAPRKTLNALKLLHSKAIWGPNSLLECYTLVLLI